MSLEDAITRVWIESLQHAFHFAKGQRAGEINGRRIKSFDERGLHPESVAWGAIQMAESLLPDLGHADVTTSPQALREAARADAWAEHVQNLTGAAA